MKLTREMALDILRDAVELAVGNKPVHCLETSPSFVSQRYIFPKKEWIGKLISKVPEFPPDVNFGTWNVSVGEKIQPTIHHPSRLGQILCLGATHTDATSKAVGMVKKLTAGIEVE